MMMATEEVICTMTTSSSGPEVICDAQGDEGPGELMTSSLLEIPSENHVSHHEHHNNNNNVGTRSPSPSRASSPSTGCTKCQKTEAESQAMVNQQKSYFETEINRLKKEAEAANKAKESMVMRYANGEVEVLKLKREMENSDKQIKQLNREIEMLNKKQKMLASERERLAVMVDSKVQEIYGLQKECDRQREDISSRDFKVKWTQNRLNSEIEAHKSTQQRLEAKIEEIGNELQEIRNRQSQPSVVEEDLEGAVTEEQSCSDTPADDLQLSYSVENNTSPLNATLKELEGLKQKNRSLIEENDSLSYRVQSLEKERLNIEEKLARLQESNSEHLHQIASLQSDLAATESLKVQLYKEEGLVAALQSECQSLRQAHVDALADMAICRGKEAELLGYTQQVTEKNVSLQSEFSSVEAKSFVLEEENERLHRQIEQLETDLKNLELMMSKESINSLREKQTVESDAEQQKNQIVELQIQLDEARGETVLLHKKLNSSVRELSKELHVARKQMKDGQPCSDALSQSSRTSSSSSLTNGDSSNCAKSKQEDSPNNEKPADINYPVIPDQQILIERIVKLQRALAKKQDKIEFLQEHNKQLVESAQKKSKIIQTYAMSQDIEALSSNISEQNKAEALKHGGIMASVYGSKPADEGLTLDLSLEINRRLQVVLEDTLLKNITLKDSLNTLGKEISKLTETNKDLTKQVTRSSQN